MSKVQEIVLNSHDEILAQTARNLIDQLPVGQRYYQKSISINLDTTRRAIGRWAEGIIPPAADQYRMFTMKKRESPEVRLRWDKMMEEISTSLWFDPSDSDLAAWRSMLGK